MICPVFRGLVIGKPSKPAAADVRASVPRDPFSTEYKKYKGITNEIFRSQEKSVFYLFRELKKYSNKSGKYTHRGSADGFDFSLRKIIF